jgi:hypothetical protein
MNVLDGIETGTSAKSTRTRIYHGWVVVGAALGWATSSAGPGENEP